MGRPIPMFDFYTGPPSPPDSPCNTSTMNECGVNLHYVKVGL